jgi:O-methyltransferase
METVKNRDVLLGMLPKHIVCAEVGVLAGEYSGKILETLEPSELHLLDLFSGKVTSGDHNGENIREYDLDVEYARLRELYRANEAVHFKKGISYNTLKQFSDNSLDFIYIDCDHTFDGTFIELELAYHKLRNGGYLCGHDYSAKHFPECKRAVDLFCSTYGQEIACLTEEDKMPSFLIVLNKNNASFEESLPALIIEKELSMISPARFRSLKAGIDHVITNEIPGDVVETGVWRGGAVIFMVKYLQYLSDVVFFYNDERRITPKRHVVACDSFMGLPKPGAADVMFNLAHASTFDFGYLKVDKAAFLENLQAFNIKHTDLTVLEGWFKDTLHHMPNGISLLRMDGDYYESTMTTLELLYDKVSPGGVILIDDYRWWIGCKQAVHDFFKKRNLVLNLVQTDGDDTEAWFIKG